MNFIRADLDPLWFSAVSGWERRGAERYSFKRFEFDFKVGHSKNIFNNYSCSPPSLSIPPLLLSKICMVLQCWSWEAGEMTLLFCHRRIWWNVGVTNCFFCSKRLHSACDYHLAHVPPSVLAVVVFIIDRFDAETVIVCSVQRGDPAIDVPLGQLHTLFVTRSGGWRGACSVCFESS